MRVPLRFLLGLVGGFLLGIGFFIALLYSQLGIPTNFSSWTYDISQKKEALAAAIPGRRVLLVGGSGVTFGLEAEEIERLTGRRTLNMGTHAGLGIDYLLSRVEKYSRSGDTVVLFIEYQLYMKSAPTEVLDDYLLSRDPDYFRQLSWGAKVSMATRVAFKRFQKGWAIRRKPEPESRPRPPYSQGALYINGYGDEMGNTVANRLPPNAEMSKITTTLVKGIASDHQPGFERVRAFVLWARQHKITVLAAFPNLMFHPEYDGAKSLQSFRTIADFYTKLGVPVVGTAREAMFPPDQYFDTPYHLTREAAIVRTDRLAPELAPYLNSGP